MTSSIKLQSKSQVIKLKIFPLFDFIANNENTCFPFLLSIFSPNLMSFKISWAIFFHFLYSTSFNARKLSFDWISLLAWDYHIKIFTKISDNFQNLNLKHFVVSWRDIIPSFLNKRWKELHCVCDLKKKKLMSHYVVR